MSCLVASASGITEAIGGAASAPRVADAPASVFFDTTIGRCAPGRALDKALACSLCKVCLRVCVNVCLCVHVRASVCVRLCALLRVMCLCLLAET